MKTYSKILVLMTLGIFALSFVSCNKDEDDKKNYTLEGTWEGNMSVQTNINGEYYDASYSKICFLHDPYSESSGSGYWVDFYNDNLWGDYNYVANHIKWELHNGIITIHFLEDNRTVDIDWYTLDDHFNGRICWEGGTKTFSLKHVSSSNWESYKKWGYEVDCNTLEGTWEGNMYARTNMNGENYEASYSRVCFLNDPDQNFSGNGYWIDFYNDKYWGDCDYVANHIKWRVHDGIITITFLEDNITVDIDRISINDNFNGRICWESGAKTFSLKHITSLNWETYEYWGYKNNNSLEGTWEGNMFNAYQWNGHYYSISYSQVCFLRDPYRYTSGTGYWVDYFDGNYWGNYNYLAYHIEWEVNNSTISIYFVEDNDKVYIQNYERNGNYFFGKLGSSDGHWEQFCLEFVSSPNWEMFKNWGSDWYYYSNGTIMEEGNNLRKKDGRKRVHR